jgi:type I restriction enzyme S subunit
VSWPLVKLGELFKVTSGGTPSRKKPEYYENGNIHWIKTGDLHKKYINSATEFITEDAFKSSSTKLYPPDTVLLAMYGATIGACAILKVQASTNQACAAFTPVKDVDPLFLYYFLKSNKSTFVNAGAGGAQPNISGTYLKKHEIPLPPLPVQKQIAAVLEKADTLRQQCQQMEQELNTLAQSVFLDMFGDPVTNPKEWDKLNLGSVCSKITDGTHKTPIYKEVGIKFLSAKNISSGRIDWINTKFISQEEHSQLIKRCNPELGDVLLAKSGTIGIAAIVNRDTEFSLFESAALIKYDRKKLIGEYVLYLMNSESIRQLYKKSTKGNSIKHLHLIDIRKFEVPIPPLKLQIEFTNKIKQLEKNVFVSSTKGIEIDAMFNSLMQRAFKGELDLKDVA